MTDAKGAIAIMFRYWLLALLTVGLAAGCGSKPSTSSVPDDPLTPAPTADSSALSPTKTTEEQAVGSSIRVLDAPQPLTTDALWEQLQKPGETLYVVLLRHALAPGTGDPTNFQLQDCTTQRNLSDEGRSQAIAIGQAFRDRGVGVQQVLSSQWCRCLDTAELLDLGQVVPEPALNSFFQNRDTAEAQTNAVKQYLLAKAERPGVIVMVTHQVNITDLTGIVPRSGEAVVLQVNAADLTQIGQLMPAL